MNQKQISPLDDIHIVRQIVSYIGTYQYRYVAGVNHLFYNVYIEQFSSRFGPVSRYAKKKQFMTEIYPVTVERAKLCFQEIDSDDHWDLYFQRRLFATACRNGNISLLDYLFTENCDWDFQTWTEAAEHGFPSILQWLQSNRCPWCVENIMASAMRGGHISVLEWLYQSDVYPWQNKYVSQYAAKYGHIHVLQWLQQSTGHILDEEICHSTAKYGRITALQWLHVNGCPWDKPACMQVAYEYDEHHVVQWIRSLDDDDDNNNNKNRRDVSLVE